MGNDTQDLAARGKSLDDVLAECIAAEEARKSIDRGQFLNAYPQFAEELIEFFANRDQIQRLALPLRGSSDANGTSNRPLVKVRYFGDYELLEEIAAGGMGIVYKARQVSLNRIVAVKMILKGAVASEDDIKRFRGEAEAAANLQHPAIVAIHEVGFHEGQHYFSMDYVDGYSLAQLAREQPLSVHQAAEYVRDAAEAVHYAHQQGTLHRDLKPSNILIDGAGRVRITDFGLAKRIHGNNDLTLTGQILGTPSYMPPEQASGKRSLVAAASDIYSLGAVLYELLVGRPPFRNESPVETLRQLVTFDPVSPRLLNPVVPQDLETICLKCLEKEPNKRYETAELLADDLGRYLRGEAVRARPPSVAYRLQKFARRNRTSLAMASLILLFIVLLGGVAGWMLRDRAARLAKTAEEIRVVLQDAQLLRDQALKHIDDNPYQWEVTLAAALAACRRAESLAEPDRNAFHPALVNRISKLTTGLQLDERDREFVGQIDVIRLEASEVDAQESQFRTGRQALAFKALFKTRGIEFGKTTPAEAAGWVRSRPGPVQKHLLAAFDCWLNGTRSEAAAEKQWLTAVLKAADGDPWRTQARQALLARDVAALDKLVQDAEMSVQPLPFLLLLADGVPQQPESSKLVLLRQIQNRYPSDFWANEKLALALARTEPPQWIEAVRFHSSGVSLRPENQGARFYLGRALRETGDLDGARSEYRKAFRLNPYNSTMVTNLGVALFETGDFDEAIARLSYATRLDPRSVMAHNGLGNVLAAKGDLDGAITEYREAIRLDAKYAKAHNGLGIALKAKGDLDGAITEYREAIRLDAKDANYHNNLGSVLYEKRDFSGAIATLRQAIALKPDYYVAHDWLGYILLMRGDVDGSVTCFQEALRVNPNYAKAHMNLGNALRKKGDHDGAIAAYRKALEVKPGLAEAEATLKSILEEKLSSDDAPPLKQ